jgi:hypothetical protein
MRRTPTIWDQDVVMKVLCDKMVSSSKGIKSILKSTSYDTPNRTTVLSWIAVSETFQDIYARAREAQADYMLEEINETADNVGFPLVVDGAPLIINASETAQALAAIDYICNSSDITWPLPTQSRH